MDLAQIQTFLGWCIVINYALLLVWFAALLWTGSWVIGIHARIFGIEPATVRSEHFHLMGQFKLMIMIFNIAPWLALLLMDR